MCCRVCCINIPDFDCIHVIYQQPSQPHLRILTSQPQALFLVGSTSQDPSRLGKAFHMLEKTRTRPAGSPASNLRRKARGGRISCYGILSARYEASYLPIGTTYRYAARLVGLLSGTCLPPPMFWSRDPSNEGGPGHRTTAHEVMNCQDPPYKY